MLDLTAFNKATKSLKESIEVTEQMQSAQHLSADDPLFKTLRAGVIQNFEFTYELGWKFMKRWLAINLGKTAVEGLSRRALYRLAFEYQLINSVDEWMLFHQARNETSHTYDEQTAQEIFGVAKGFLDHANALYRQLQLKND
jgi:nucleotidyltransferase substrate binding protein (TIGR01987 family)